MKRLNFLSAAAALLSGCSYVGTKLSEQPAVHSVLESVQPLNDALIGARGMAREYSKDQISADFPINSLDTPSNARYRALAAADFKNYRLAIGGLVEKPQALSLAQLRKVPQRTQITRHDCVEGWSAIAQWTGPRLSDVLALVKPDAAARYVVFYCFDRDAQATQYYESLSLQQAYHPQTLLALEQNGSPITPDRGAPVRLRVPLQLGYKSAKWVARIELVSSLNAIYGGKGGYWEDQGYQWYAGI